MDTEPSTVPRWRSLGALISIVVVIGVVPLALDRDSFPLSTYPMFSTRRSSAEAVDTVVLVDATGTDHRLSPSQIAATDEIILATVTVSNAIRSERADLLCADVAARVRDDAAPDVAVEVVTLRYDALDWYDGERTPIDRVVHARCQVVEQ